MSTVRLFHINEPVLSFAILALLALPGCGDSASSDSPGASGDDANPPLLAAKPIGKSPDQSPGTAKTGPFAVPEGSPRDLMGYIERIGQLRPGTADEAEQRQFFTQQQNAVALAADKALAYAEDELDAKTRLEALIAKFNALAMLRRIEHPGAVERFNQCAATTVAQTDRLLADATDEETVRGAGELKLNALYIVGLGGDEAAVSRFYKFAALRAADNDQTIAKAGHAAGLNFRLSRIINGKTDDVASLVDDARDYLTSIGRNASGYELVSQIANMLDGHGDTSAARALREHLVVTFEKQTNSQLADRAKKLRRRLALVGSTLAIKGELADGQSLDWKKFQGKVVLIDFWATWCGPCIESLPELKKTYERFHDQGLEVIGISLDTDRNRLNEFLKSNRLPWPIVANMAGNLDGPFDTNAEQCGVEGIPLVVLLDQTGKVVASGFHGEKIDAQIAQLLDSDTDTGPALQ